MSVEVTRLPSGLAVITDSMPHLESASLGVWVGAGSRDERPDEHGISHLLEHMAFKGTKRRTARQIAETIEAVGGDLNAATSVESTGYFARVLKADVSLALDVLSDILSEPTFDPEELKREQNVIVQEIGATEDAPDDLVFDRLQEIAFPGQPVGRSILGTPETVRSFTPARLRSYLARNYRGPDMIVAAAGAVSHQQVVAEAEARFASFAGSAGPQPEAATFSGGTRVETRDLEQVHIAMALHGVPVKDAVTTARFTSPGPRRVWVRTRDWVAPWNVPGAPGRFQVLVNGTPLATTFGTEGADWHWQSTQYFTPANAGVGLVDGYLEKQGSYGVINARLGWISPDESWRATVIGRNLSDRKYVTGTASYGAAIAGRPGAPRTYAIELAKKF